MAIDHYNIIAVGPLLFFFFKKSLKKPSSNWEGGMTAVGAETRIMALL